MISETPHLTCFVRFEMSHVGSSNLSSHLQSLIDQTNEFAERISDQMNTNNSLEVGVTIVQHFVQGFKIDNTHMHHLVFDIFLLRPHG
jgi:hypothetical protein